MFDQNSYEFDRRGERHAAKLRKGAVLFRLASASHATVDDLLSGGGVLSCPDPGRYNAPQQRTSYCANNVIVCLAEVLFHLYRRALSRIEDRQPAAAIRETLQDDRLLAIFRVSEIDSLVYVDSEDVSLDFDKRICGTTVVFPDPHYKALWEFNNRVRQERKRGILYPSARHSRDLCMALFYDETARIDRVSCSLVPVHLQLVPEDQDLSVPLRECLPFRDKLHATMGYYEFLDVSAFNRVRDSGLLNPSGLPVKGMIDFVRRRYRSYPGDAVCESSRTA